MNVTPAFPFSMRARSAPGMMAGQFVEGGIEYARFKSLADLDLFTAVPPVSILWTEDSLLGGRFGIRRLVGVFLIGGFSYDFFFTDPVSGSFSAGSEGSPSVDDPCNCSMRSCNCSGEISP